MSRAKEKFDKTITRCNEMVTLYYRLKDKGEDPPQDVLRAAIVLSVAAFDAFSADCFSEHFVDYLKVSGINDPIESLLSDAGFDIKFAVELINSDRPYRKIRTLINRYLEKKTFQKMRVIDDLFRCYGLKDITKRAVEKSGRNQRTFFNSIEKLIERRHGIAHDGDYNDHNRIKPVTKTDTQRIMDLKVLVDNMEWIINERFS